MSEHFHVIYTFINSEEAHAFRDLISDKLRIENPDSFLRGQIKICKNVVHN
jgi:hypothetical protein